MNLKTKLIGALVVSAVTTRALNTKRVDIYRRSVAIHREMSKATHMDWGNPLPFKSEILTKWAPSSRRSAR